MAQSQADAVKEVEKVLREEVALAKPDDLAFLEFQVPRIALRIVRRLGLRDDPSR
jgi:hypothetical protein